jgi:hypothetical protein
VSPCVEAASVEEGSRMVAAARDAGYRESGITAGAYTRPIFGSTNACCGIGGAFRDCLRGV